MTYQLTGDPNTIKRTTDDGMVSFIPNDMGNGDWRAYQAWLADGNEPEEA